MTEKKTVLLGVTGGIAAYKIPNLCSRLVKEGYNVETILTANAKKIVSPIPFESLSCNRCHDDTFDPMDTSKVEHIHLAEQADMLVIAPASANIIAKLRYGLADDMLSTTALACTCPKLLVPAMNTNMYENPATQENLQVLRERGYLIMEPASGRLACGAVGKGKMPEPDDIFDRIEAEIACEKDLAGLSILVSAGPTQEPIDPVRYITNHSSGKMGYALAHAAMLRGAKVKKSDGDMSIPLKRTQDIIGYLGSHRKEGQFLCGFSMETQDMLENSRKKLSKKNLDMIVANNLKVEGAGFQGNTNVITMITAHEVIELPLMDKEEAAHAILSKIRELRG